MTRTRRRRTRRLSCYFGLGRYGSALYDRLTKRGLRGLGVDFNPEVVAEWRGRDVRYGDAADPDFMRTRPLDRARLVLCATLIHAGRLAHAEVVRPCCTSPR